MKRCPHCGVQDHDEAILCKSCMKSFSAPPERKASAAPSAATPSSLRPQRKSSPIRSLITVLVFGAIGYSMLHPQVVQELIDRFNEMQAGQSQNAGDEPPAAAATSADAPPPAAPEPAPAPVSVQPAAASEPAAATPAPAATSAAAPAPVVPAPAPTPRRAETRPASRPPADDRAEARRPDPAPALAESAPHRRHSSPPDRSVSAAISRRPPRCATCGRSIPPTRSRSGFRAS